jgi:hypothetical protein
MQWNLEGLNVGAVFLDNFHVNGLVILSRKSYDGQISHTIILNRPIQIYGLMRTRVIIEHHSITQVYSNSFQYNDSVT